MTNCNSCNKQIKDQLKCSQCKVTIYCSQSCFKSDWKYHKLVCKQLAQQRQKQKQKQKQHINLQFQKFSTFDDFRDLRIIGHATSKTTCNKVALKQMSKSDVKRKNKQDDLVMQKHCLTVLDNCQYVSKYYGTFQNQFNVFVLTQYLQGGQLWSRCCLSGIRNRNIHKIYFSHILKGLKQIHDKGIVHRDVKPQNIMFTKNGDLKFIDFGTAKDINRPDLKGSGNGRKGTPNYMAPQCVHNKCSQFKSDVFSLAGVYFFLRTGHPAFYGGSDYLIFKKSTQGEIYIPSQFFDQNQKQLLTKMLAVKLQDRIQLNQIFNHILFKDIDFNNLPKIQSITITKLQQIYDNFGISLRKICQAFSKQQIDEKKRNQKIRELYKEIQIKILQQQNQKDQIQDILRKIRILTNIQLKGDTNYGLKQAIQQIDKEIQ